MSDLAPLRANLLLIYDALPKQLRAGAHWILEHPNDVSLLSMREQARRAGVTPSTMTRLAQRLGFGGYETIREIYADAFRNSVSGFSTKAAKLIEKRLASGEDSIGTEIVMSTAHYVEGLAKPETLNLIGNVAKEMVEANHIFILGQRSCFPVAYHLVYLLRLIGRKVSLLDGPGGTGFDLLGNITAGDVLFAICIYPYTKATIDMVNYARERNARIIAITDTSVSPLARAADHSILVGTDTQSFFHTITPAFSAVELIAAIVSARTGEESRANLMKNEAHLRDIRVYTLPTTGW